MITNLTKDHPNGIQVLVLDQDFTAAQIPGLLGPTYDKPGNFCCAKDFSKIFARNATSWELTSIGGGSASNIFYAEYGTTTYQAVLDAVLAGQLAVVYKKATEPDLQLETYISYYAGPGDVSFVHVDQNSAGVLYSRVIKVLADNSWHQYDQTEFCELQAGTNVTITKTLVEGRYKSVIAASGGGDNIFVATYNTTTFADIQAAYNAGKVVFAKASNNVVAPLYYLTTTTASFCYNTTTSAATFTCTASGWNSYSSQIQKKLTAGTGIAIDTSTNTISLSLPTITGDAEY